MDSDSQSYPDQRARGQTVLHRAHHDGREKSLSTSVLMALDALPGYDASTGERDLFRAIDPDALDALFAATPQASRESGEVTFTVADYEVSVSASGEIIVRTASPTDP